MAKTLILIVDDHTIIRDGIKALLEDTDNLEIHAEAETGEEALEICRSQPIDLVIMDINMPGMGGIEATRVITAKFPDIKVLALTMLHEEEHIRRMLEAGASGYILKNSGTGEMHEAIETILKGKHYFSDDAKQAVMRNIVESGTGSKKSTADPANLTERELEVLGLICREYTNPEIAEELYISVRTVDAHRRNLLQKTGARNTAGLVRYAMEHKLFG